VTVGLNIGAGGHGGVVVSFTNISPAACTLHGYPQVAALDAAGRPVVKAAHTLLGYLYGLRSGSRVPTVTLKPGATAGAGLEWIENPAEPGQSSCPTYHSVLVTPPNTVTSVQQPIAHLYLCRLSRSRDYPDTATASDPTSSRRWASLVSERARCRDNHRLSRKASRLSGAL
jgi:hypothetical protein